MGLWTVGIQEAILPGDWEFWSEASASRLGGSISPAETACELSLSIAGVERAFSQVRLIKVDHHNRLKQETMQHLL